MEISKSMQSPFFSFSNSCMTSFCSRMRCTFSSILLRVFMTQWAHSTYPPLKFLSCQQMWSKTIYVRAHVKNPMWSMFIDHIDLMTLFNKSFLFFLFVKTKSKNVYEVEVYSLHYLGSFFIYSQENWFKRWITYFYGLWIYYYCNAKSLIVWMISFKILRKDCIVFLIT